MKLFDNKEDFFNFLNFCKNLVVLLFCLVGFIYFTIKISESKIDKTRYCPYCGYDIVYNLKK